MLKFTWEWQQLIDTVLAAQSAILDSVNYTSVYDQGGIYNTKVDCNMLNGGSEVKSSKLTLFTQPRSICRCQTGFIQMMVH